MESFKRMMRMSLYVYRDDIEGMKRLYEVHGEGIHDIEKTAMANLLCVSSASMLLCLHGMGVDLDDFVFRTSGSVLHRAIKYNESDKIASLIRICKEPGGCKLRTTNADGYNALHYACYYGNLDLVKVILTIDEGMLDIRLYTSFSVRLGIVVPSYLSHKGEETMLPFALSAIDLAAVVGYKDIVYYLSSRSAEVIEGTPTERILNANR